MRAAFFCLVVCVLLAQVCVAAETWPQVNYAASDTTYVIEDSVPRSFDLNNLPYGELTVDEDTLLDLGDIRFVEVIADGTADVSFYEDGGSWWCSVTLNTATYVIVSYWSDY